MVLLYWYWRGMVFLYWYCMELVVCAQMLALQDAPRQDPVRVSLERLLQLELNPHPCCATGFSSRFGTTPTALSCFAPGLLQCVGRPAQTRGHLSKQDAISTFLFHCAPSSEPKHNDDRTVGDSRHHNLQCKNPCNASPSRSQCTQGFSSRSGHSERVSLLGWARGRR